ncbi:uncharacterized protein JCM6883_002164 [Sporobolomyces salmoneus]|uniref:uncharacterized protein n=1 Tax=Sporobolomyces salmoneus TaxID=183962 RepID=UPI00317330D9
MLICRRDGPKARTPAIWVACPPSLYQYDSHDFYFQTAPGPSLAEIVNQWGNPLPLGYETGMATYKAQDCSVAVDEIKTSDSRSYRHEFTMTRVDPTNAMNGPDQIREIKWEGRYRIYRHPSNEEIPHIAKYFKFSANKIRPPPRLRTLGKARAF